ncbi:hypothetical protein TZ03_09135 [Pseudomonas sp. 10-1B]|nr:hypothetical protein TZ03_09135 [Pseudomonas sp. 10-1B]
MVVLEKGRIAGEQSSGNLGWVRKTNRHAHDIPLTLAADLVSQSDPLIDPTPYRFERFDVAA